MYEEYEKLLVHKEEDEYTLKLVKAADRLSALIKCIEEEQMGNREFSKAGDEIRKSIEKYDLPEIKVFIRDFLPSYYLSLDDQNIGL